MTRRRRRSEPRRAAAHWRSTRRTGAPRSSRRCSTRRPPVPPGMDGDADVWGIVPAAGAGSRIQPLAFSKELLPVGSRIEGGVERPRAVGEYVIERLIAGGATRLCIVIAPGKSDIVSFFGGAVGGVPVCYAVQQRPAGLCDA